MVKLLVRVNWVNALVYWDGKMSKADESSKDSGTITVMDPKCSVDKNTSHRMETELFGRR